MKNIRLLSLCLLSSALTLTACAKEDGAGDEDPTASAGPSTGDEDDPSTGEEEDTDSTTETGGESASTFGTDTNTDTAGFVPDNDVVGVSECDPWTQDCPDGEKCVAYGSTGGNWDANKCVQIIGDGSEGDPCTYDGTTASTDSCGAGTWCWNVNEDNEGVCTAFCTGSADDPVCEPGYGCSIANNGSIILCLLSCDPLLQDCPGTDSCFYDFSGNFVCAFGTSDLPAGEPCGFINDCSGGNVCLSSEVLPECAGASCCTEFCDLLEPTCTIVGTECQAFFEEGAEPPGYEDVGVCIIPGA